MAIMADETEPKPQPNGTVSYKTVAIMNIAIAGYMQCKDDMKICLMLTVVAVAALVLVGWSSWLKHKN